MALTVVIAYDVSEDRRRARLAGLLQRYGDRIQFSVFLCRVADDELVQLMDEAKGLVDPSTDSIYTIHQCLDCWGKVTTMGQARPPEPVFYWAVF